MVRVTQIKLLDRLLLLGPPGIGKTEIIKQLAEREARELNKIFVDIREASDSVLDAVLREPEKYYVYYRIIAPHIFPEDLGIPRMTGAYVEFLPPKVLKVLATEGVYGVLFIDEITNVQRDDQLSMLYSLILEKEASWILKLSRNIKIVLAGNPPEWSEITRPLPKPLRNRVSIVNVAPPTVDEWIEYMNTRYGDNWEKLAGAYLKTYPEDLLKPPSDDDFAAYPTPRSWTNTAVMLKQFSDYSDEFVEELVIGNLGKETGARFLALLRTRIDVIKAIDELSKDPAKFSAMQLNAKLLVINAVSQMPVEEIKAKLSKFIEWLAQNDREMLVLAIMLMRREKRLEFAKHYINLLRSVVAEIAKYM